MLEWKKRAKIKTYCTGSVSRSYETKCGKYRVGELKSKFKTKWYALECRENDSERIISTHRKKGPAIQSAEKHHAKKLKAAAPKKRKKRLAA